MTSDTVTNRGTRRWISGYLVWLDKRIMLSFQLLSQRTEHCKLGAFIALDSVSLLSKRHSIAVICDRQRKRLNRLKLAIGFKCQTTTEMAETVLSINPTLSDVLKEETIQILKSNTN